MATLNVWELTSNELSKSSVKESVKKSKKKSMKESAKFGRRMRKPAKIAANKIQLESIRFFEDAEEDIVDYTPDEDVMLVIDPEMDETPETVEDAQEAAEELVGDYVCKCAICGANYICNHEDIDMVEDLESEEGECPICGETGEQILVGEIAPAEESDADLEADEDEPEELIDVDVDVDVDGEDFGDEDFEDEFADEDFEDEFADDDIDVDVDIDVDTEDEDEVEESINRTMRRTALRRESANRHSARRTPAKRTMSRESRNRTARSRRMAENRKTNGKMYNLDEVTLNRMLTKFAKENYENVRFVKITNAKCNKSRLTLEGTVVTKKGNKRSTKFVCENFVPSAKMTATFKEIGVFTENATSKNNAFTISFNVNKNVITPTSLRYSYKVKENRNNYLVSGKVINESVRKYK